jgi:hypothetical protein
LHPIGGDLATVCRHEGTITSGGRGISCVNERTMYLSIPSLSEKLSQDTLFDVRPTITRVRFQEEQNVYFANPHRLTVKDVSTRWYSVEELRTFRTKRSRRVHEMLKFDQNHRSTVNFQTVLVKACEWCCQSNDDGDRIHIPAEFFGCLAKLLDMCQSRLGLEVVGVPQIALRQQKMRREMYRSIQMIQAQTSWNHPVEHNEPTATQESLIRRACESYTRPAARYAQLVALAHAVAPER